MYKIFVESLAFGCVPDGKSGHNVKMLFIPYGFQIECSTTLAKIPCFIPLFHLDSKENVPDFCGKFAIWFYS